MEDHDKVTGRGWLNTDRCIKNGGFFWGWGAVLAYNKRSFLPELAAVPHKCGQPGKQPPIASSRLSLMVRQRAPLAPGYLSNFKAAHRTTKLYEIKSLYRV
jgi:hypothetical protein